MRHPRRDGRNDRYQLRVLLIALAVIAAAAAPAGAHKVTVFAWVEGDTVITESKFSGGRMARQARIEVYDGSGNLLLDGLTDDEGRFSFTAPKKEDLQVVLVAGTGHRNTWMIKAEEFAGQTPRVAEDNAVAANAVQPLAETVSLQDEHVSRDELQTMIETALDKKLQPVLHRLRRMEDGPRLADIIGGLGYIIGLVGLATYLQYRRRSRAEDTRAD